MLPEGSFVASSVLCSEFRRRFFFEEASSSEHGNP
jgi:hypothetical protein